MSIDLRLCADLEASLADRDRQIGDLRSELSSRPTADAYNAACKALAHWRKEAKRLGRLAGVPPREMKAKR